MGHGMGLSSVGKHDVDDFIPTFFLARALTWIELD